MSTSEDEPWFKDGLSFACTQCGKCCTGAPGYVWVNREEVAALARRLKLSEAAFEEKYTRTEGSRRTLVEKPNYDCIFYDRAVGCTVYEDRPRQCRTWPFWDSNLKTPKTWEATCQICPGSGTGRLYTVEEILAQKKIVKV
jgi:hypothetical protein